MLSNSENTNSYKQNCSVLDEQNLINLMTQMHEALTHIKQYLNIRINQMAIAEPTPETNDIVLSAREYEMLFLLFLGNSDLDAARYLNKIHGEIPGYTIIKYKRQLFDKFKVASTTELINKASELNAITHVPVSFKTANNPQYANFYAIENSATC